MLAESGIYAIRACEFLALYNKEDFCITRNLSRELELSNEYLVKILQKLKKAGIIRSQKGATGGVQLNRDAQEITLFQIIEASNPSFLESLSATGIKELKQKHEMLYHQIDQHLGNVQNFLHTTTLKTFTEYRSGGINII